MPKTFEANLNTTLNAETFYSLEKFAQDWEQTNRLTVGAVR